MAEQIISKKCCTCKQIKPISEFHKNKSTKDGFRLECKICHGAEVAKYQKTPKGRIAHIRAGLKYRKSEKGEAAQKRLAEREQQMKKSNLHSYDKMKKKQIRTFNPVKAWSVTLTSKQLRAVVDLVEDEAKDPVPILRKKTNELFVLFSMLRISEWQIRNLNIEDMPFHHREPHITVRVPRSAERRKFIIDRRLETKIREYWQEFREDANPTDPFLINRLLKRLTWPGMNEMLKRIAGKLGIKTLPPGILNRTLREAESGRYNDYEKKEINWALLPLSITKFIETNVDVRKDAKGKPNKTQVAAIKARIKYADKKNFLKPPLPEPIGGRRGEKYKNTYKLLKLRTCYSRWRKIPGWEDLEPLLPWRKVKKNKS